MKLVALKPCLVNGRTDIVHCFLYHGAATRDGRGPVDSVAYFCGDNYTDPLKISIGGRPLREFAVPSPTCTPVISSRLKRCLVGLPNVAFVPVEFVKLVDSSQVAGDFSPLAVDADMMTATGFFNSFEHSQELQPLEPYFELPLVNAYRSPLTATACYLKTVRLPHLGSPNVEMRLSTELIDKCPIFYSSAIVFDRDVFDMLSELVPFDPDYFTHAEFSV